MCLGWYGWCGLGIKPRSALRVGDRRHDATAGVPGIAAAIAGIAAAIAVGVRLTARVPDTVAVAVLLAGIGDLGAEIASVADAVPVGVTLLRVGEARTDVAGVSCAVGVIVVLGVVGDAGAVLTDSHGRAVEQRDRAGTDRAVADAAIRGPRSGWIGA